MSYYKYKCEELNIECQDKFNTILKLENLVSKFKQEHEELKEKLKRTQNLYSKQYQINENKGYLKAEQKLERIKEVIENSCITLPIELCEQRCCCECTLLSSGDSIEIIKEIIEDE